MAKKIVWLILSCIMVLTPVLASCGLASVEEEEVVEEVTGEEADFTGFITEIHPIEKKDTLGQILVESQAEKLVDKYMVTIKDETLIFKQEGEERSQVTFEALETKQQVQIWFSGPIMESFPMQGTAQQVVIIEY